MGDFRGRCSLEEIYLRYFREEINVNVAGMTTIFRRSWPIIWRWRIAVISTIIILAGMSAVLSAVESPTLLQQDSAALFLSC